jgi:hypothetical protein
MSAVDRPDAVLEVRPEPIVILNKLGELWRRAFDDVLIEVQQRVKDLMKVAADCLY